MSLTDRFLQLRGEAPAGKPEEPQHPTPVDVFQSPSTLGRIHEAKTAAEARSDVVEVQQTASIASEALNALKERASQALFERLGSRITDSSIGEAELHQSVKDELKLVVEEEQIPLTGQERQRLIREIIDDILGHGPIQRFLDDPAVTEVMVNRFDQIYVERDGQLHLTDTKFTSDEALRRVIERIVSNVGRRIDESSPLVDARLADGSRVNAIIPPLAVNGPALTIRKFGQGSADRQQPDLDGQPVP